MPLEFPASVPFEPTAQQDFLSSIQGNILKSHGRTHVRLVFFTGLSTRKRAAALIAEALQTNRITSAWNQREQAERRKAGGAEESFFSLILTKEFFWTVAKSEFPPESGDAFLVGALGRGRNPAQWDAPYRQNPQGVWLLAHESPDELAKEVGRLEQLLTKHGARVLRKVTPAASAATEAGFRWHDAGDREAMREPFGFRDGLSGSVFLKPEAAAPPHVQIGLDRVLIPDGPHAGGSFFVLQKLDQNVAAFRAFEKTLAAAFKDNGISLPTTDAGALMIGRERDGRPLVAGGTAASNGFDFESDPSAARCPFHAHIRKANPRVKNFPNESLLDRQFVRRSVIYDERGQLPANSAPNYPQGDAIAGDVGLLFMGYMRDVLSQFEHMRRTWFESPKFPSAVSLPDPVLAGGLAARGEWNWPQFDTRLKVPGLQNFVTDRGMLFGYAPSVPWLRAFVAATRP